MTIIVAGVLVAENDKFLLVQENQPKCKGKWNLPMGSLEENETISDCAGREGEEETGFFFKLLSLIGIYQQNIFSGNGDRKVGFIFSAEIAGGNLALSEEIMDVRWFSFAEIEEMSRQGLLRASYIINTIDDFKTGKSFPLEILQTITA